MNKLEINFAIAEIVAKSKGLKLGIHEGCVEMQTERTLGKSLISYRIVDYCGNWNDLMSLVVKCGISLTWLEQHGVWMADYGNQLMTVEAIEHESPQIAAATCLLKYLENECE